MNIKSFIYCCRVNSVEAETPSLKKTREAGMMAVIKEGLTEGIIARILGLKELIDDRLNAKAVRYGEEVHLSDDIKEAVGGDIDKQGKEESW